VRWFLSRRVPAIERVLLVESGSRSLAERVLPILRATMGERLPVDLVTCYPGLPAGFPPETRVFQVSAYAGRAGRRLLYRELRRGSYSALGVLTSGEPIMTKWKWALAVRVPAKVFLINENADYFWLDRGHWRLLRRLAAMRLGLSGSGAARTLAQLLAFPFVVGYLLLYAGFVHTRRVLRQALPTR
jgi:hypothetical protein